MVIFNCNGAQITSGSGKCILLALCFVMEPKSQVVLVSAFC